MIYKPEEELYALVRSVLLAAGADQENAVAVAAHLVRANLSGVDSHGVWHLCRYVEEIQEGAIVPAAHPEILRETPGSALVSGNWGFGHPVGAYAMEMAIAKAAEQGMAVTSVVQKHHVGRLGHYVEMAAERGMIGMALAAGQGVADPAAVPYGGAEKLLHTNPLAVAFPTGVADHPLMFDFATSATAGSRCPMPSGAGRSWSMATSSTGTAARPTIRASSSPAAVTRRSADTRATPSC